MRILQLGDGLTGPAGALGRRISSRPPPPARLPPTKRPAPLETQAPDTHEGLSRHTASPARPRFLLGSRPGFALELKSCLKFRDGHGFCWACPEPGSEDVASRAIAAGEGAEEPRPGPPRIGRRGARGGGGEAQRHRRAGGTGTDAPPEPQVRPWGPRAAACLSLQHPRGLLPPPGQRGFRWFGAGGSNLSFVPLPLAPAGDLLDGRQHPPPSFNLCSGPRAPPHAVAFVPPGSAGGGLGAQEVAAFSPGAFLAEPSPAQRASRGHPGPPSVADVSASLHLPFSLPFIPPSSIRWSWVGRFPFLLLRRCWQGRGSRCSSCWRHGRRRWGPP